MYRVVGKIKNRKYVSRTAQVATRRWVTAHLLFLSVTSYPATTITRHVSEDVN